MSTQIYPINGTRHTSNKQFRKTCHLLSTIFSFLDAINSREFAALRDTLNAYLEQPAHLRAAAEALPEDQLYDQ